MRLPKIEKKIITPPKLPVFTRKEIAIPKLPSNSVDIKSLIAEIEGRLKPEIEKQAKEASKRLDFDVDKIVSQVVGLIKQGTDKYNDINNVIDTPERIRDKLKQLSEGQRLDATFIDGLMDKIKTDELVRFVAQGIIDRKLLDISHIRNAFSYAKQSKKIDFSDLRWHGAGTGGGAGQQRDNLSSQCDGSNMIFNLTNAYKSGTVQLWSTQFPIVYNPDVDFTETGAAQITLVAAQVSPPDAGQTLVAIYEKL